MFNKLFVLLIFAGFLNWYLTEPETNVTEFVYTQDTVDGDNGVILYATQWCGYCEKAREFMASNNIEYQEYDIEKSEKGANDYKALNGNGVPLLVVNNKVIRGYKPSEIMAALD
ncbi:MAG TPA: glutaredoxin family protein [Gammaproteobacteria bacterium]|nr:glutaredoxin family protein [Gammaproteobacteria bacterium]